MCQFWALVEECDTFQWPAAWQIYGRSTLGYSNVNSTLIAGLRPCLFHLILRHPETLPNPFFFPTNVHRSHSSFNYRLKTRPTRWCASWCNSVTYRPRTRRQPATQWPSVSNNLSKVELIIRDRVKTPRRRGKNESSAGAVLAARRMPTLHVDGDRTAWRAGSWEKYLSEESSGSSTITFTRPAFTVFTCNNCFVNQPFISIYRFIFWN